MEIGIGLPITILLLCQFALLLHYFMLGEVDENHPHQRYALIWFSLMFATLGLSALLRFVAIKLPFFNSISALIWTLSTIMFGSGFVWIGVFEKDSINGGIPLVPASINQWLGSLFFILLGCIVVLLSPKIYRYKRDNG